MDDYNDDSFNPNSLGNFRDESERKLYEALRKNPNLDYDPEEDEVTEEQYLAMVERKKRIAERREEGRNRRAQEAAARAAKEKAKDAKRSPKKVPVATKPVVRKPKPENDPEGEDAIMYGSKRKLTQKEKDRNGRKIFYICLGIYALVLIILGFIFLRYTDKCLRRYEATRYENAIDDLVKEFTLKVKDGTVLNMVKIPEHACVFESEDLYRTTYLNLLQSSGTFSYEKDKKSYDTTHPVYDIFSSDGSLVAKIRLKSVNQKTIFAILTVGDWVIDSVTPSFSVTTNTYRISIPDNYKVTVNGIGVTDEFRKGEPVPVEVKLAEDVLAHVRIPSVVTYEIDGLAEEPTIVIYNGTGEEVPYTPDENGNIKIEAQVGTKPDTMSQDRHDFALETAQMWTDFLTRDLGGSNYGLGTIQKRLIKDSYYYNEADHYAHDVDITFISDHRDAKPKYTDVSVTDYTEYSDECYSCHIQFTKNMILIKTGQLRTVTVDTTNFYVYVDDSDDGVINPHWCVADMKTTTKTTETEATE